MSAQTCAFNGARSPHGPATDGAEPPAELVARMSVHCRSGRSLPGEAYTDAALHRFDLDRVFARQWLFAGHSCELREPGDFFLFEIADESFIVVRDRQGEVRAHANVCRHRGSRMCSSPSGNSANIVCPYHQWSYGLDGQLRSARLMGEDFDRADYPLHGVPVRDVEGMIFLCLSNDPPDFDAAWVTMAAQVRLNRLAEAKVACRLNYTVRANWKVLVENNRECYHCRGGHPEFCLSNFDVGVNGDLRRSPDFEQARGQVQQTWSRLGIATADVNFPDGAGYRIARFPLKEGFLTESLDGRPVGPLMGDVPESGIGSLRIVVLPNAWIHVNCDYAVTTRITPLDPQTTHAQVTFLVDGEAEAGVDFDADRVAAVWRATSEQDWELCERMQHGIRSRYYQPGPYSPIAENSVRAFVDWYLRQIQLPADEQD